MKFCAVVFLVYLAIATDAIKRKKVCKQIIGKLSDLEVLIKKKQGCCTVGKVFVPLQSRIVRMTLETQVWIKCFSLNFLGTWTTPLRLVLPEKNINNAKTYFRHRANGFEGRIHLTRYASNFAQRTSYFFGFSKYVQKYRQYLFQRYIRPTAIAWWKACVWSPSTLFWGGIVRSSNSD